jgi:hypothetical protein
MCSYFFCLIIKLISFITFIVHYNVLYHHFVLTEFLHNTALAVLLVDLMRDLLKYNSFHLGSFVYFSAQTAAATVRATIWRIHIMVSLLF